MFRAGPLNECRVFLSRAGSQARRLRVRVFPPPARSPTVAEPTELHPQHTMLLRKLRVNQHAYGADVVG
jgi:hypothetical protein